ncbi:hypothetical protein Tco_0124983 [Tanacetum coccineum]
MKSKPSCDVEKKVDKDLRKQSECNDQEKEDNVNNTNNVNTVSSIVNDAGTNEVNVVGGKTSIELPVDPNMPALEDYSIFDFSSDGQDNGAEADMNNVGNKRLLNCYYYWFKLLLLVMKITTASYSFYCW